MIILDKINKYYKSGQGMFHALKDVSLTFPDKGLIYIVGKSGSGKSTLLNIIGGIDSYDSGELIVDDIKTSSFSRKDYNNYRNTYIGFIFQEFNVIRNLTVYENIALSLELHNKSPKEHHQDIIDMIELVGLNGKENRRMNEISGGEKQRVAIARALIKKPRVIIADEPTGNLDSKNRDIVMDILKKLATEHLVIVVTHDKKLSSTYGDREITIKDGGIINDILLTETISPEETNKQLALEPIAPSIKTSFTLAIKSFLQNKARFIFIIILFSFSLLFAGSVINLYVADTAKEYANFQDDYGNFAVNLSQKYSAKGFVSNSAFFTLSLDEYRNRFTKDSDGTIVAFTSIPIDIDISLKSPLDDEFYVSQIDNINIFPNESVLTFTHTTYISTPTDAYDCYITDYLAMALIKHKFFDGCTEISQLLGKTISMDGFKGAFFIKKIIKTNYNTFVSSDFSDSKVKAAFLDNLMYYNALFVSNDTYSNFFNVSNADYFYDDIVYEALGTKGFQEGVRYTYMKNSYQILTGNSPVKPQPGEQNQLAISRGMLKDFFNVNWEDVSFKAGTECGLLVSEGAVATFFFCGTKRVPTSSYYIVTAIIDEDDYVIYTPSIDEHTIFANIIRGSYCEGGFLLLTIGDDVTENSLLYKDMLDNNISINNISFTKLKLIDQFIKDNLILFLGLFFIFCLFSVLMIFNFIIINIKNSTRDIGIYMSLGMNGFKISMIYFFQVILISTISLIIGLIGTEIFLIVIDAIFSKQALIDFTILKFTFIGVLITFLLAYLTPIIAVIFPLLGLSRKKPIDVIKVS